MSNSTSPNGIEKSLVSIWIEDEKPREYAKLNKLLVKKRTCIVKEAQDLLEKGEITQKEFKELSEEYKEIDNFWDVCEEFGKDTWQCPKCKTLHMYKYYKQGDIRLDEVYEKIPRKEWSKYEND
jgi:hypothetical protein